MTFQDIILILRAVTLLLLPDFHLLLVFKSLVLLGVKYDCVCSDSSMMYVHSVQ